MMLKININLCKSNRVLIIRAHHIWYEILSVSIVLVVSNVANEVMLYFVVVCIGWQLRCAFSVLILTICSFVLMYLC